MITSGKHVKKINGKLLKDQEFNLDVNPNGQNRIFLKTQEFENGKHNYSLQLADKIVSKKRKVKEIDTNQHNLCLDV